MPLHIDRVETEVDVLPAGEPNTAGPAGLTGTVAALKEKLRSIVLEILNEELERLRRKQG